MLTSYFCNKCKDKNLLIECECGYCDKVITKNVYDWRFPDKVRTRRFRSGHNNIKFGEESPSWKGGKSPHSGGYNTLNINGKYVLEHRIIWEQYHNACLLPWSHVHHRDGNKKNNDIDNLEGMTSIQHIKLHSPHKHPNHIKNPNRYK